MADLSNVNVKIPGHQQKKVANKQEDSYLKPRGTYNTDAEYKNALDTRIRKGENYKERIYPDTNKENLPTVGIGYCLARREWEKEFKEAGITLSKEQINDIKSLIDKRITIDEYNAKPNALKLSEKQAEDLYNVVIKKIENVLKSGLKNDKLFDDLKNSHEKVALISMVYNTGKGGIGDGIRTALNNGNRPEAFYEIRYRTNKERHHGIANRRMRESKEFGLYKDENNIKIEEALDAVGFLELKREKIKEYLDECYGDKKEYENLKKTDLDTQLKPANELLLNKLSDLIVKSNPAKFSHEDVKNQLNKALKEQKINTKELFENITNQLSNKLGISKQNPSDKNEYLQTQYNELLKHAGGNLQIQNLEFANKKLLDEAIQAQTQASQSQSLGLR